MHDENLSGTSLSSKTAHRGLRLSVLISLPRISQDLGNGSRLAQRACGFFHIISTHSPIILWFGYVQCNLSATQGKEEALTISACRFVFPSDHRAGQVHTGDMDVYRGPYLTMTTSEVPLQAPQPKVKWERPAFLSQVLAPQKECRLWAPRMFSKYCFLFERAWNV